jgi:Skp family chaperone for outer membrane proteins
MTRQLPILATFALILTLLAAVTLHGQANSASPTKVAVLDVQKVFQALDERSAVDADLTQETERLQKQEQEQRQKLKEMEADLSILGRDSDAYKQTMAKAEQMAIELQAWLQVKQRRLEQERTLRVQDLYNKILGATQRLAEQQGYDLVVQRDMQNVRPENQKELAAMILSRKVIYASNQLDITEVVTQLLNNEFNNRAK